ncbi:MAG: hypothetical protein ACE5HV_07260 [Acidobacteriota bacterium]
MQANPRDELGTRIDTIEESYEFMLAYAAQGLAGDRASKSGGKLRELMERAAAALSGLAELFLTLVGEEKVEARQRYRAFIDVLERDADSSQAAIQLVLSQPVISSQLVDNLNASIHLRALLTDLFIVDEILKLTAETARSAELEGSR